MRYSDGFALPLARVTGAQKHEDRPGSGGQSAEICDPVRQASVASLANVLATGRF